MEIKTNSCMNSVNTPFNGALSKTQDKDKAGTEIKPASNTDTFTISVAGKEFTAQKKESDSAMFSAEIVSDLDSFRSAIKSTHEPLPVNWEKVVDPYNTFTNMAKIESRLKSLTDPSVSHNDEDMERVAEAYAKNKIDILIEKKKAMLDSGTAKSYSEEYAEYKTAYDAYHSENGKQLIDMMSGDMKKAYGIYKSIIDGKKTPSYLDDEEFLMLYNNTMYRGAKAEWVRKNEELYSKRYTVRHE